MAAKSKMVALFFNKNQNKTVITQLHLVDLRWLPRVITNIVLIERELENET